MLNMIKNLLKPSIYIDSHYFKLLSANQREIYALLKNGIEALATEIKIPSRPINEVNLIFNYILLDNPIFFYTSSFEILNDLYKQKAIVRPQYKYPKNFIKQNRDLARNFLQTFDSIKSKSDLEKEIYVHDYCLDNFSYDYSFEENSFSILGAILNKKAVCEGIAKFVKFVFDYLDVESLVVSGKASNPVHEEKLESHAWNIVRIDGNTYHLDVTFDMTIKNRENRYDYFNLCDEEIKRDHLITESVPICTGKGFDYYSKNSMIVRGMGNIEKYITNNIKMGKNRILFKLVDVHNKENIVNEIMDIAQKTYIKTLNKNVSLELEYNLNQFVFDIIFK